MIYFIDLFILYIILSSWFILFQTNQLILKPFSLHHAFTESIKATFTLYHICLETTFKFFAIRKCQSTLPFFSIIFELAYIVKSVPS